MKNIEKEIKKAERLDNAASIQRQKVCALIRPYIDMSGNEEEMDIERYIDSLSVEMSTDGLVFVDYNARNIPVDNVFAHIRLFGSISFERFISLSI